MSLESLQDDITTCLCNHFTLRRSVASIVDVLKWNYGSSSGDLCLENAGYIFRFPPNDKLSVAFESMVMFSRAWVFSVDCIEITGQKLIFNFNRSLVMYKVLSFFNSLPVPLLEHGEFRTGYKEMIQHSSLSMLRTHFFRLAAERSLEYCALFANTQLSTEAVSRVCIPILSKKGCNGPCTEYDADCSGRSETLASDCDLFPFSPLSSAIGPSIATRSLVLSSESVSQTSNCKSSTIPNRQSNSTNLPFPSRESALFVTNPSSSRELTSLAPDFSLFSLEVSGSLPDPSSSSLQPICSTPDISSSSRKNASSTPTSLLPTSSASNPSQTSRESAPYPSPKFGESASSASNLSPLRESTSSTPSPSPTSRESTSSALNPPLTSAESASSASNPSPTSRESASSAPNHSPLRESTSTAQESASSASNSSSLRESTSSTPNPLLTSRESASSVPNSSRLSRRPSSEQCSARVVDRSDGKVMHVQFADYVKRLRQNLASEYLEPCSHTDDCSASGSGLNVVELTELFLVYHLLSVSARVPCRLPLTGDLTSLRSSLRQFIFIVYNCRRARALLLSWSQLVEAGSWPPLLPTASGCSRLVVDQLASLLHWVLVWQHLCRLPALLLQVRSRDPCRVHEVCRWLVATCHAFSRLYRHDRVLPSVGTCGAEFLVPAVHARVMLVRATLRAFVIALDVLTLVQ